MVPTCIAPAMEPAQAGSLFEGDDKCLLCGEQMLSLACPGGCFTATAHEVDGLACKDRQLKKARAACAAWMEVTAPLALIFANPPVNATDSGEFEKGGPVRRKDVYAIQCVRNSRNPGQPLLADYDRLRRLEAAVEDDELAYAAAFAVCGSRTCTYRGAIEVYRATLRKRAKGD